MPSIEDNCSLFVFHHSSEMTKQAQLVHPDGIVQVPVHALLHKCDLSLKHPLLVDIFYKVSSPVSLEILREFVSKLNDERMRITKANFRGLLLLCDEFSFSTLASEVTAFERCQLLNEAKMNEILNRLPILERTAENQFGVLSDREQHIQALEQRVKQFQTGLAALKSQINQLFLHLKATRELDSIILSDLCMLIPNISSSILSGFPPIFGHFKGKQFSLLWRGSRDGFTANSFHERCDGHENTLMIVIDTEGNIFGGFTPAQWQSGSPHTWKADNSQKSFLFTLKNPHNVPEMRFSLNPEKRGEAILGDSKIGPSFGDISLSDKCDQNTSSSTEHFGTNYANSTSLEGKTFFTGSTTFRVKDVEIFEIIN
jgi:hypothetical protein